MILNKSLIDINPLRAWPSIDFNGIIRRIDLVDHEAVGEAGAAVEE